MAPPTAMAPSGRRRSFAFFSRPPTLITDLDAPANWEQPRGEGSRPRSLFGAPNGFTDFSPVTPTTPITNGLTSTRVIQRSKTVPRPKSMFGSLRGRDTELSSPIMPTYSESSSLEDSSTSEAPWLVLPRSTSFIHFGEVVTGGSLLRKKREFMVLTDMELLKYKTEAKAIEALGHQPKDTRKRASSLVQPGEYASQHTLMTPMNQVVAVHYPTSENETKGTVVQVDFLELPTGAPSSTTLSAPSRSEAQIWVDRLRTVAAKTVQETSAPPYPDIAIEHIARRLEVEDDYSPTHFQIFRVVQKPGKNGTKSSEDLHKLYSSMCYLAIGIHKVHLVPFKHNTVKNAGTLPPTAASTSFGILNLTALWLSSVDDSFSITFRSPCQPPVRLNLASSDGQDIIQSLRQASEYLRPMWHLPSFKVDIPSRLNDNALPEIPPTPGDDLNGFDRTLAAYCKAYGVDASNIVYCVHMDVEDAPLFQLYPPTHPRRRYYNSLELLAVMRTLRWNEYFVSISFRGISLDSLMNVYDYYGSEYEPTRDRSGRQLNIKASQGTKPLLTHELRALALYSSKLRRMDFFESLRQQGDHGVSSPVDASKMEVQACSIVEAIMPLCRRGYTNVDWFDLTGIELGEADLDWLVDAAASRLAHFRGFELQRCGLTERMLTLFLNALITHENTLEGLNISGNPCRLNAATINNAMAYFPFLRKLNISGITKSTEEEPILTAETLGMWRLEDLDLSETKLNQATVNALAAYLSSPQSLSLRYLGLTRCALSASSAALLLRSMSSVYTPLDSPSISPTTSSSPSSPFNSAPSAPRQLHLHIGQNPLHHNPDALHTAISLSQTPTHLSLRMLDYPLEPPLQSLIRSLTMNKSLRYLDLSAISLPFEPSALTSSLLSDLFAFNTTLRELDISGEQAVLESASLGSALLKPLSRLSENKTLEILRVERQGLGTRGAMELATVIQKNNTLREIYCEGNEIHLQGFTAMVDALQGNESLLYLPRLDGDRGEMVRGLKERLGDGFVAVRREWEGPPQPGSGNGGGSGRERKGIWASLGRRRIMGPKLGRMQSVEIERERESRLQKDLGLVEEKWELEVNRMLALLNRNKKIWCREREVKGDLGQGMLWYDGGKTLLWGVDAS